MIVLAMSTSAVPVARADVVGAPVGRRTVAKPHHRRRRIVDVDVVAALQAVAVNRHGAIAEREVNHAIDDAVSDARRPAGPGPYGLVTRAIV